MGEGLDKIGHSFAQKLSLNLFGPSKISDQILYWYTYLKGLKDPPDWVRVFIVTSVDVISYWTWGCSEPQQGNDCSSCGTAQWSHGISRIKKDCYRMKTFERVFASFLPINWAELKNFKWSLQLLGFVALLFNKWRRTCITSQKGTSHRKCHAHGNQWDYSCE